MVLGYDAQFTSDWGRRGRTIIPKTVVRAAPAVIRKAREGSLGVRGAQIFNLLPENLRSINTGCVDLFKNHLHIFQTNQKLQGWAELLIPTPFFISCPFTRDRPFEFEFVV